MRIVTSSALFAYPMGSSTSTSEIPTKPGIYAFYLALGSRRSLGLYEGATCSDEELKTAKTLFIKQLKSFKNLLASRTLLGRAKELGKSSLLSASYAVELKERYIPIKEQSIFLMEKGDFLEMIDLISDFSLLQKPIYVGKAESQSLQDRCKQHQDDFTSGATSKFGGRLKQHGVQWEDLVFVCRPLSNFSLSLDTPEKILQLISNPILSLR